MKEISLDFLQLFSPLIQIRFMLHDTCLLLMIEWIVATLVFPLYFIIKVDSTPMDLHVLPVNIYFTKSYVIWNT